MLGLEDLQGSDKIKKTAPCCLILALISLPLNDPRRLCIWIWIFSSSQMGCLQDNSLYNYIIYIIDLIMEHINMRIPVGKCMEH